jgi:epoxyqueuosine reductase
MNARIRKRLLLHVCCAPCAVYVHECLAVLYDVTCLFYNPNIQPFSEYKLRERELERIAAMKKWKVLYGEYDPVGWNGVVAGLEEEPERGRRCAVCFRYRFEKTFAMASDLDFEMVASTLSISPYKNLKQINGEGERLARETGIPFLNENFRKQDGYKKSQERSSALGIRQQNYCGCMFSKADRERRLKPER